MDGNPTLFSVMAALNAAGYDAGLTSPADQPFRSQVRAHLAARTIPVLPELKRFIREHKTEDSGGLGPYISFALSVAGPPAFESRFRANEIPPDVIALEGFAALMSRFHQEAGIDELWSKAQPAFDEAIARYHEPISRALLEVNGYLRNPTSGYMGRTFQIYIDLLGPPNQIHTRSYGDDYYVVVPPSAQPQAEEIRHAYLHYLLDPLATKYSAELNKKRGLGDYALGSPVLAESYKSDFLLLATESLIRAVEARLASPSSGKGPAMIQQALSEGFVLAPFFGEQLPAYEKGQAAMRLHFPDMVAAIDLKKEEKRLENIDFTATPPARKVALSESAAVKPEASPAAGTLEEAEKHYTDRNLDRARQLYNQVLQAGERPLHSRAYYGLARIAALERNPELAEELFHKTLELEPDGQTASWAQVYLGRLADSADRREQATQHYQAALAVSGASPAALKAAEQGLKDKFQKTK
ncbi:MAG: tetratricopeptide repeat protein [Bryobacteraceae bacterium]